jgi:hypothetical protein
MIRWDMPAVGNPGAEVASISGMLSAIAESRERQQQEAAQRAFQERQFAAQQANIAEDNRRAAEQLAMQQAQQKAHAEAVKAQEQRTQRETFAQKALPGAQVALRNDDVQGARLALKPYGGDVTEDTSGQETAQAAQQQRQGAAFDRVASKVPQLGIFDLLTLPVQASEHANRAAAPTPEEQQQAQKRYRISGPVGDVLDYSPAEANAGEQRGFERNAATLDRAAQVAGVPFQGRAASVGKAQTLVGASPEEALTRGLASAAVGEQQEGSDRRAAAGAAKAATTKGNIDKDNARADSGGFRAARNSWETHAGLPALQQDLTKFRQMSSGIQDYKKKGDTVGMKAALYAAARYITGPGVLTAPEYDNTVRNTKGWVEGIKSKLQQGLDGQISTAEERAIELFVKNANAMIQRRAEIALESYDAEFGEGSYEAGTVPDQIKAYRKSLVKRLGIKEKAVTPSDLGSLDAEADKLLKGGR